MNIYIALATIILGLSACKAYKDLPKSLVQNDPTQPVDGSLVPSEVITRLEDCKPDGSAEICKENFEELNNVSENHSKEIEKLKNEIKIICDKREAEQATKSDEFKGLNTKLDVTMASKAALEIQLNDSKQELAKIQTENKKFKTEMEAANDRTKEYDKLLVLKAELEKQLSAAQSAGEQTQLREQLANLESQLSASAEHMRKINQQVLAAYVVTLNSGVASAQRSALFEETVLKDSSRAEESRKDAVNLQGKITTFTSYLASNDAANIARKIKELAGDVTIVDLSSRQLENMLSKERDLLSLELTRKNADIEKLLAKLNSQDGQIKALVDQGQVLYQAEYERINQLEMGLATFLRRPPAAMNSEAYDKIDAELAAAMTAMESAIAGCKSMASPSRNCISDGQKYYNLAKRRKLLQVDRKYDELYSGDLTQMGPEAKANLKNMWEAYKKALSGVIDVRASKKITDAELTSLKGYFPGADQGP